MGFRGLGTKFLTKCKMGREDHKGELVEIIAVVTAVMNLDVKVLRL